MKNPKTKTVTIGSIEKFITENAWENGWIKPLKISNNKNQSIGIIGANSITFKSRKASWFAL